MPQSPENTLTGKIVEWDDQKGFGFLQVGQKRVFLHRRDFAERHKRPAVGDVVRFTMGKDAKGRPCAINAAHVNDGGRITLLAVVVLAGLLALPVIACWRLGVGALLIGLWAMVMSLVCYAAYVSDKRSARQGEWRLAETELHLMELAGGWPGAFLAQRRVRHKVSKARFQIIFWAIVLGYQVVAGDSLQNWQATKAVWNRVSQHGVSTRVPTRQPVIEIITNRNAVSRTGKTP